MNIIISDENLHTELLALLLIMPPSGGMLEYEAEWFQYRLDCGLYHNRYKLSQAFNQLSVVFARQFALRRVEDG